MDSGKEKRTLARDNSDDEGWGGSVGRCGQGRRRKQLSVDKQANLGRYLP